MVVLRRVLTSDCPVPEIKQPPQVGCTLHSIKVGRPLETRLDFKCGGVTHDMKSLLSVYKRPLIKSRIETTYFNLLQIRRGSHCRKPWSPSEGSEPICGAVKRPGASKSPGRQDSSAFYTGKSILEFEFIFIGSLFLIKI